MKNTKTLLGIFSWERGGARRVNQNVEIIGRGNFDHQTAEQPRDSQAELERKVAEKTRDLSALYSLTGPISQAGDLTGVLDDAVLKL